MKKLLVCAVLALFSFNATQALATNAQLNDIDNHWAYESITRWNDLDVILGNNNSFNPDANITRGDFAVIVDRLMGYNETTYNFFSDLDNEYYTDAVLKLFNAGIMTNQGSSIAPNDLVSREDACVMIAKALHYDASASYNSDTFNDDSLINQDSKPYVYALADKGIISGDLNNNFNPDKSVTRAELSKILDTSIALYANTEQTYSMDVIGTVVIHARDASLANMNIDGDVIIAENVADGDVTFTNVVINGNITIKGGGENSLYFDNVQVSGSTNISKEGSGVRIVASSNTTIPELHIEGDAIIKTTDLTTEGYVDGISIDYARKVEFIGDFATIDNNIPHVDISVDGTFDSFNMNEGGTVNGFTQEAGDTVAPSDIKPSTGNNVVVKPSTPSVTTPSVTLPEGHNSISVGSSSNGSVSISASSAVENKLVSISATPDEGYELAYIVITYGGVSETLPGTSFFMPDFAVTVSAVFSPISAD